LDLTVNPGGVTTRGFFMSDHYKLQDVAASIHRDYQFLTEAEIENIKAGILPRICNCHKAPQEGSLKAGIGEMQIWKGDDSAHFRGLQSCGSVWACPHCGSKIANFRADEVKRGSQIYLDRDDKNCLVMVTFTIPHVYSDSLDILYSRFMKARRLLRQQKPLKRKKMLVWSELMDGWATHGQIAAIEATYSDRNGWHPHSHDLLMVSRDVSQKDIENYQTQIAEAWLYACKRSKLFIPKEKDFLKHSVQVERMKSVNDYLCKLSDLDTEARQKEITEIKRCCNERWNHADEICRANSKHSRSAKGITPFDMLRLIEASPGDDEIYKKYGRLYRQFTRVMFGKRQIFWSKGLKTDLGVLDISDQDIADAHEEVGAQYFMSINMEIWRVVLTMGLRSYLKEIAVTWSRDKIEDWLTSLWRTHGQGKDDYQQAGERMASCA